MEEAENVLESKEISNTNFMNTYICIKPISFVSERRTRGIASLGTQPQVYTFETKVEVGDVLNEEQVAELRLDPEEIEEYFYDTDSLDKWFAERRGSILNSESD